MSTYRVSIPKVVWLSINVEAATEEAAIEEAFQEAPGLCAHCAGFGKGYAVDEDDWGAIEDVAPQFKVTAELMGGAER